MAQWNHSERTLTAKLVYYGPAMSGKTTNLEAIHRITDPAGTSPLVSLKTSGDRTLFFDLLSLDLGELFGYRIGLQLYTVPGQVAYNSTRKIVLTGADGVAFIADSTPGREKDNHLALENLRVNLRAAGADPGTVPLVVQYNKRDVPGALSPAAIEAQLKSGRSGIAATALTGEGVIETLARLCQETLAHLAGVLRGSGPPVERSALDARVETVLGPFLRVAPAPVMSAPGAGARSADAAGEAANAPTAHPDDLMHQSLDENLRMARELIDLAGTRKRLSVRVAELESLHALVHEVAQTRDPGRMIERLADAAAGIPGVAGATVIEKSGESGALSERVLRGLRTDPASVPDQSGDTLARRLLAGGVAVTAGDMAADLPGTESHPAFAGIGSLLALPLAGREHPPLLLIVYGSADRATALGADEMRYLSLLGLQISTCLDNAMLYGRLATYSEQLDNEVRQRTSDLRKAYGKLQELDAMKDRFLSNISHEMRTPLTAIIASADLLASMGEPGEPQAEFVGMIQTSAGSLARMVEDVIQLWVMRQGGSRPVIAQALALDEVVRQAVAESGDAARARTVDLLFEPARDCASLDVAGDAYLLRTALRHLIGNAIKFSPAGSTVKVGFEVPPADARASGQRVCLTVRDEGPGIPEADRERVMGRFEQLGAIMTDKPAGLGLGLPLAAEIAARHGGTLSLDAAEGGGTVARLILPLVQVPVTAESLA